MVYSLGTRDHWPMGERRCELHRAGCRDLTGGKYVYVDPCDGVEDAVESGLASDADDIRVMPCTRGPVDGR